MAKRSQGLAGPEYPDFAAAQNINIVEKTDFHFLLHAVEGASCQAPERSPDRSLKAAKRLLCAASRLSSQGKNFRNNAALNYLTANLGSTVDAYTGRRQRGP